VWLSLPGRSDSERAAAENDGTAGAAAGLDILSAAGADRGAVGHPIVVLRAPGDRRAGLGAAGMHHLDAAARHHRIAPEPARLDRHPAAGRDHHAAHRTAGGDHHAALIGVLNGDRRREYGAALVQRLDGLDDRSVDPADIGLDLVEIARIGVVGVDRLGQAVGAQRRDDAVLDHAADDVICGGHLAAVDIGLRRLPAGQHAGAVVDLARLGPPVGAYCRHHLTELRSRGVQGLRRGRRTAVDVGRGRLDKIEEAGACGVFLQRGGKPVGAGGDHAR